MRTPTITGTWFVGGTAVIALSAEIEDILVKLKLLISNKLQVILSQMYSKNRLRVKKTHGYKNTCLFVVYISLEIK